MKTFSANFMLIICCLASLASVIKFWNSPERWKLTLSLVGFGIFLVMLILLLLTRKKRSRN